MPRTSASCGVDLQHVLGVPGDVGGTPGLGADVVLGEDPAGGEDQREAAVACARWSARRRSARDGPCRGRTRRRASSGVPCGACVVDTATASSRRASRRANETPAKVGVVGGDLVHDLRGARRRASGSPSRGAISQTTSHSSLPTLAGITGRTRLMRRSALVNVPSFSRNEVPGRKTWANLRRLVEEEVLDHDEVHRPQRGLRRAGCSGRTGRCPRPGRRAPGTCRPSAASNMLGIRSPGSGPAARPHSCS